MGEATSAFLAVALVALLALLYAFDFWTLVTALS